MLLMLKSHKCVELETVDKIELCRVEKCPECWLLQKTQSFLSFIWQIFIGEPENRPHSVISVTSE